jgi:hypothetical protein
MLLRRFAYFSLLPILSIVSHGADLRSLRICIFNQILKAAQNGQADDFLELLGEGCNIELQDEVHFDNSMRLQIFEHCRVIVDGISCVF